MAATNYPLDISTYFTGLVAPYTIPDCGRFLEEVNADPTITKAWDGGPNVSGATCNCPFKDALSAGEETQLHTLAAAHTGTPLAGDPSPVEIENTFVPVGKPDTTRRTIFSHNWVDPTTWYQQATRVVDEVAGDSGDHTTYELDHTNVIDTYHGKLTNEDFLVDGSENSYRAVVKVNDVEKTEQDPHTGTGGDYTINYAAGEVTFLAALQAEDVVKVTYHYAGTGADGSRFTIKPLPGKSLAIDMTEVQFSDDIVINDTVTFELWGNIGSGMEPLAEAIKYKAMADYLNDSARSYPSYPALGGASNWRAMSKPVYILDWDYVARTRLLSSLSMEIRISLDHGAKHGGTYATFTAYCTEVDE